MPTAPPRDLWVFGYGSLMWRPGFAYVERRPALLRGWRRRLCVYSHVYRGTAERPGLVLGLDRGGACRGVAFRVEAALAEATVRYLRERELVTAVYLERVVPVTLDDGRRVSALTYLADRAHGQYAGPDAARGAADAGQAGRRPVGPQRRIRAQHPRPSARARHRRRRARMARRSAARRVRRGGGEVVERGAPFGRRRGEQVKVELEPAGERRRRLGETSDDRLGEGAGVGERDDAPPAVGSAATAISAASQ